jgi:Kelch motif/Galactose oxidase, central domain
MTSQRELDRLLGDFFAEGTDELADRVLDAALDQIDHTQQRRAMWLPRRVSRMNMYARFAVAAAIGVLAVGSGLYLIRPTLPVVGGPSPTLGPSSSPAPTAASPAPVPTLPTGPMMSGRGLHTATLLRDGRVLIVGGFATYQVALASAEIYDPTRDTFSPTGSLATPRGQHTATLLADGRVLVVGGFTGGGISNTTSLASAEIYDPKTGTFTATGSMAEGRGFHDATLLADGRVLVTGGDHDVNTPVATAEIYDPATGTFSPTGSMAVARTVHTATLLADGRVLIAGGGNAKTGGCVGSAEVYDPGTGAFSATGTMTHNRCGHDATVLPDGRVLLTGGSTNWLGSAGQLSADLYNPATGTFSPTGSMADARTEHTATRLLDGRVLIAGGAANLTNSLDSAELYDPATGTFSPTGSMATTRMWHTATRLPDGRVLVTGGDSVSWDFNGPFLSSAEIYDPATGTFSPAGRGG